MADGLQAELARALKAHEAAPEWLRRIPIANTDRVISQRIAEAAADVEPGVESVVIDVSESFTPRNPSDG